MYNNSSIWLKMILNYLVSIYIYIGVEKYWISTSSRLLLHDAYMFIILLDSMSNLLAKLLLIHFISQRNIRLSWAFILLFGPCSLLQLGWDTKWMLHFPSHIPHSMLITFIWIVCHSVERFAKWTHLAPKLAGSVIRVGSSDE